MCGPVKRDDGEFCMRLYSRIVTLFFHYIIRLYTVFSHTFLRICSKKASEPLELYIGFVTDKKIMLISAGYFVQLVPGNYVHFVNFIMERI